ncbi:MAG: hypothetical protein R3E32_11365 [Chitinophagales bacterium]
MRSFLGDKQPSIVSAFGGCFLKNSYGNRILLKVAAMYDFGSFLLRTN